MILWSKLFFSSSQETEVTSTPTRPVENVVLTTKRPTGQKKQLLDGRTVENKGKLILSEIGVNLLLIGLWYHLESPDERSCILEIQLIN